MYNLLIFTNKIEKADREHKMNKNKNNLEYQNLNIAELRLHSIYTNKHAQFQISELIVELLLLKLWCRSSNNRSSTCSIPFSEC